MAARYAEDDGASSSAEECPEHVTHTHTSGASSYGVSRSLRWAGPGTSPSVVDATIAVPQSECQAVPQAGCQATGIEAAVAAAVGVLHDLQHQCAEAEASSERCGQTEWCKLCCSDRSSRCSGNGSGHSSGSDHPHPRDCSARGWRCNRTASSAWEGSIATSTNRLDEAWWQLGRCIASSRLDRAWWQLGRCIAGTCE